MKNNITVIPPTYAVKVCHNDGQQIFTVNNTTFYAGKYINAFSAKYDLIIDLSGSVRPQVEQYNLPQNLRAFTENQSPSLLQIEWPDFSIIKWTTEDYKRLLQAIADDQIKTVYICCVGGHGRTGTLMCILASLSNVIPDDACPVEWLRNKYCQNVVESEEQMQYITHVTGRKVKAQGSKMHIYTTPIPTGKKQYQPRNKGYTYFDDWETDWQPAASNNNEDANVYSGHFLNPKG